MNTDIRIATGLPRHRKYLHLKRLIGQDPMSFLVNFWIAVAEQSPNGALNGWSNGCIEDAAGWSGESGKLLGAMVKSGFLDIDQNGEYSPHDWENNQPWVCGAKDRSNAAKIAGKASAKARKDKFGTAQPSNGSRTTRLTPTERISNPRTPSPSPSPLPLRSKESLSGERCTTAVSTESSSGGVVDVNLTMPDVVDFG